MNTWHIKSVARGASIALSVALAASCARPAFAEPPTGDALYQQLGADPGLVRLMDDFMARLIADPRMHPFFKDSDQKDLKHKLVLQFCEVSGGPCKAADSDMKKTHSGFDIGKTDFNAMVEVLQQSMDAQGIPFGAQNRLLAQLAPMHRQIINTP
jgi:hemoglobin